MLVPVCCQVTVSELTCWVEKPVFQTVEPLTSIFAAKEAVFAYGLLPPSVPLKVLIESWSILKLKLMFWALPVLLVIVSVRVTTVPAFCVRFQGNVKLFSITEPKCPAPSDAAETLEDIQLL